MSSADTEDPFIIGLRKIVRVEWSTQEEFAKGVTSKVNMSNILRGNVGTSRRMREALASKAGLTVEEVIELGKKKVVMPEMVIRPNIQIPDIHEMTGNEIHNRINECNLKLQESIIDYSRAMNNALTGLIQERDELISLVYLERSTLNAISEVVKVVDPDMKIIACNRACTEKYMQVIGDNCAIDGWDICSGQCTAKKAFLTGQIERKLWVDGDVIETCTGYPMVASDGTVGAVAVVISSLFSSSQLLRKPVFNL